MKLDVYFIVSSEKQCHEMSRRKTADWGWGRGKSPKWTHLHLFPCEIYSLPCLSPWGQDGPVMSGPDSGRGWASLARLGSNLSSVRGRCMASGQRPPSVSPVATLEDGIVLLSCGYGNTWPHMGGTTNNRDFLSHDSGGQKSEVKVLGGLVPSEGGFS